MIDYWNSYWNKSKIIYNNNLHSQVGRTIKGIPVKEETWFKTINFIFDKLNINSDMKVIDICSGNGLISEKLATVVKEVVAVDYSKKFVDQLKMKKICNIEVFLSDIRKFDYKKNSYFDAAICYFALQHFKLHDVIQIFKKIYNMLLPDGKFYIGDIPDLDKIWEFHSSEQYRNDFFYSIEKKKPIIGTWFKKDTLVYLSKYCGFSQQCIIDQENYMINSKYRFDLMLIK